MFNQDDRVKVTSVDQHSAHEGKIGIVEKVEVGAQLYYVRFSADDADYIAEADLTLQLPPVAEGAVTVHQLGSLVSADYGNEEEEEQKPVTTGITSTASTATDTWRRDDGLTAWHWQDFYMYDDGRCYDGRTGTLYQPLQDGVYYTDSGYFNLDTNRARDSWIVPYIPPPQPATPAVQGRYDTRTKKTFYPTGDGTFVDEDNASYFYDTSRRRYEPLTDVRASTRELQPPAATRPVTTHRLHDEQSAGPRERKRRLEVDDRPRAYARTDEGPSETTPSTPQRTPARQTAPPTQPADTSFTVDDASFVLDFQEGGRNEQLGHSVTRHGEEYQRSVQHGTQQLREVMYNAPVYSADEYERQLRRACVAAAALCEADPGNYGKMLEVSDLQNRQWRIILARSNQRRTYRVRHAHLENYQNQ